MSSDTGADSDQVLRAALALLRLRRSVHSTTIQVEPYDLTMDDCEPCQLPPAEPR